MANPRIECRKPYDRPDRHDSRLARAFWEAPGSSSATLAWRDIKVQYKQTALGASWAISSRSAMVVFSFFGKLAGSPTACRTRLELRRPRAVDVLLPGADAVGEQPRVESGPASEVYFPRPSIGTVLSAAVDFASRFWCCSASWRSTTSGHASPSVIPLAGLAFVAALGIGLWLAALSRYRDALRRPNPGAVLALRHPDRVSVDLLQSGGAPSMPSTPWPAWPKVSVGSGREDPTGTDHRRLHGGAILILVGAPLLPPERRTFADIV
jgi:hypothetical protein